MCRGHPNIAFLYGVCSPSIDRPLIITALYTVSGTPQTLSDALPINRCNELLCVLIGILKGLEFMHNKKILHNDIKCDNIVLSDNVPCDAPPHQTIWPVIIDFNKATPFSSTKMYTLSKEWRIKYKAKYTQLAPDLIDGCVRQSPSTDVYSFGALMKKALSYSSAFKESAMRSKLWKLANDCTAYGSTSRPSTSHLLSSIHLLQA